MADMNEVVVNQDGQVEGSSDEKLTTGEKLILGGTCIGIGTAGYFLGTYVFAPLIRKARSKAAETEYERAKRRAKVRKTSPKPKVDYDEDGDYREVDDNEEDDD